ncbi:MAG TPA: FtsK/SpoIIIE domain-containing protein, partial [Polyangium sp.]|nr:FtsK/SpoIIIE domain-containing protein [Polyangium sp.]
QLGPALNAVSDAPVSVSGTTSADLSLQGGEDVEKSLVRIAQKGRAAGIHLILSTQRPDAKTFSGLLRSNIPSRIALTVQKATESKIILDDLGAEKLLKPGDMLVRLNGGEPTRVHGIFLSPEDVARIVNDAR